MTKSTTTETKSQKRAEPDAEQLQFASATLDEFADSWKRPGDFSEETEIIGVVPERCEKNIIKEVTAVENRETVEIPPSRYESQTESLVSFDDRYETAKNGFPEKTIEYIGESQKVDTCSTCTGSGQNKCPNCKNGKARCGTCSGDGMEKCSNCSGWGSAGSQGRIACPDCNATGKQGSGENERSCSACNGRGHVMCNSCSGAGEHRCTTCGGGGIVTCGTCNGSTKVTCSTCQGEGELVTTDTGTIEFSSTETTEGVTDTGVPEKYITQQNGTKFKIDDDWTDLTELDTEATVRQQVERRHVDVTSIDYSYGGQEWVVYDVEGSIRADDYPKSSTRSVIPWVFLMGLILITGYGVYQYVL